MTHQFIDPVQSDSLAFLVESAARNLLRDYSAPVSLEIDIHEELTLPAGAQSLTSLVTSLIGQALEEMPGGGDLSITAVENLQGGIELEIADTGCEIASRPQSRPMVAAVMHAELQWLNCPQGGGCVTVIFAPQADSHVIMDRKAA